MMPCNSDALGEYAGLLAIRRYHESRGDDQRTLCLISNSAHGTNPASAQMPGMAVEVVACDKQGNIDLHYLREKAAQAGDRLSCIIATYPSSHGVYEETIREVCQIVHQHGGQVYLDGVNMNAQVGITTPGYIGADVSHLNLHKTFCIPHGGGGPGMGPIGVKAHLAPFVPRHQVVHIDGLLTTQCAVSAAPFGSASILPISWMYIRMMGAEGLKNASQVAILNANYIATRLKDAYPVLYTGRDGCVAQGEWPLEDNPLVNAPHTQQEMVSEWSHPYSRELAVFPARAEHKYWPSVKRLDDVYGDRSLLCSCVPIGDYA